MTIYKSSFNKKPEKKEKPVEEKQEKPEKIKPVKQKTKSTTKINPAWIFLSVFSLLFLACVIPNNFIKSFVLGLVGLTIYPVCVIGIFFSIIFLKKKKYAFRKKYIALLSSALFVIWFVFHLILTSKIPVTTYGAYLGQTYLAKTTAGGLLFSLISFPIIKLLTIVGAYIFSGIALAILVGFIIDYINTQKAGSKAERKSRFDFDSIEELNLEPETEPIVEKLQKPEEVEDLRTKAKKQLGLEKSESTIISSSMPNYEVNLQQPTPLSKRDYILTPLDPVIPTEKDDNPFNKTYEQKRVQVSNMDEFVKPVISTNVEEIINPIETKPIEENPIETKESFNTYLDTNFEDEEDNYVENEISSLETSTEEIDDIILDEDEDLSGYETAFETDTDFDSNEEDEDESLNANQEIFEDNEVEDLEDLNENYETEESASNEVEEITPNIEVKEYVDEYAYNKQTEGFGNTDDVEIVRPSIDISKFNLPNTIKKPVSEEPELKEELISTLEIPPYVAPPVELLNYIDNPSRISDEELQDNIERLEQVLEDFKVPAKVNNVQVGPAVTRYELTMPRGISVNKIAQMSDDIAMTLASNGAIRVEAPIPGKNSVGIEVPNAQVSSVSLRELIDSEAFRTRGNPLSFVLGKDINGDIIFCNLDKMPHVLVAGSTGSGKSVCLNTMLLSMCYKSGPEDLRLILVDPKMVEFSTYNGLPHLLIPEVITNKDMTINALDWSIKEMERRYALFAKTHVVNINEFNKSEAVRTKKEQKLPFIVIVVDELADLMLEAKREIEDRISKLAAKARASGIHLVLATQRPSVDVITGTVKTNLPSRIAFALTNYMDSKTVLDGGGAEKLLGKGDMLFKPQDKPEPRRVQGAYVSNPEISKVVQFIKDNNQPVYDDNAGRAIKNPHQAKSQGTDIAGAKETEFDPVLKDALRWFIQMKQASGSMISRRYSVGFNRAGRIMDQMERAGFIGPQEGSKPRQVLITLDEYKAIFGED